MACICVLPLLSYLTKHNVSEDEPGYVARFKATSVNDTSERALDIKSVEILQIAIALDPRHKTLKCLSDDAKE